MPHTKTPRQQRRRMALLAMLYLSLGVFIIGFIFAITATLRIVDSIRADQQTNTRTYEAILDCTQPQGECAKAGARRTGEAVSTIGQLSVYASACAADVDTSLPVRKRVRLIERCVKSLVDQPPAVP